MRLIDANAFEFEPDENCIANGVLIWGGRSGGKTMTTVLSTLKKMVDNAPTVDAVEVVHAHWVPFYEEVPIYNGGGFTERRQTGWVCSKCGEGFTRFGHQKYCGDCGARMDGDDHEQG